MHVHTKKHLQQDWVNSDMKKNEPGHGEKLGHWSGTAKPASFW